MLILVVCSVGFDSQCQDSLVRQRFAGLGAVNDRDRAGLRPKGGISGRLEPVVGSHAWASPRRSQLAIFLLGTTNLLYVSVGLRFYAAETVIAVVVTVALIAGQLRWSLFRKETKVLLALGFCWLFGTALSNVISPGPGEETLADMGTVLFTLCALTFFIEVLGSSRPLLIAYAWGMAVSPYLAYLAQPDHYVHTSPWRLGLGSGLTLLVLLLLTTRRIPAFASFAMVLGLAVVNFSLNARGVGATLVAVLLFALILPRPRANEGLHKSGATLLKLVGMVLIAVLVGAVIYPLAAGSGLFGAGAQERYERQSQYSSSYLLVARPGPILAIPAIAKSPILGRGSDVQATTEDLSSSRRLAALMGINPSTLGGYLERTGPTGERLPAVDGHSALLSAWVTAGIFGALFFLQSATYLVKALLATGSSKGILWPMAPFVLAGGILNIFLNPQGVRTTLAFAIGIAVHVSASRSMPLQGLKKRSGIRAQSPSSVKG